MRSSRDRASEPDKLEQVLRRAAKADERAVTERPLGPDNVTKLQRLAGNQATTKMVQRWASSAEEDRKVGGEPSRPAAVPLQRWSLTDGLKKFGSWVKGLFTSKKSKKGEEETATPEKETVAPPQAVAPQEERGTKPIHPPAPRPGFDLAGGQEILTKAFGGVKSIVPGKIEVLDQAGFQAAYDKIYGSGNYSWDKYVLPKYGGLNGFAHDGTNYINKTSAGLHTIVHEMLHNNAASDWIPAVGSRWNEGTTEILTQQACALFNEPAPVCYPGESPVVAEALANGLPKEDLAAAYLNGGAMKKVAAWVDAHCALPWAKVKEQMEAQNWAAAKAGLALKTSTTLTPEPATK